MTTFAGEFRRADWTERSACKALGETYGHDTVTRLFFPAPGESHEPAKAICGACVVRAQCLEYALETPEHHGIWGGYSERERQGIRRDRGPRVARVKPLRHGRWETYSRCANRPEGACEACKEAHTRYRSALRDGAA
jgi:WhiB family transcriptional regulator, redox-sensing transcriptional regulator